MRRWLNIIGLPFDLWSEENLILVGEEYGDMLVVDMDSSKAHNLYVARGSC